jgi:formiminotetrahydrofolate cyclodeaminase
MGFLEPKQTKKERKAKRSRERTAPMRYEFKATEDNSDVKEMLMQLLRDDENVFEKYIDVYDLAWQLRYEMKATKQMRIKYRKMQSEDPTVDTYVPKAMLLHLKKIVNILTDKQQTTNDEEE